MCFKKLVLFLFFSLLSCGKENRGFIVFNKDMRKLSEVNYSNMDISENAGKDVFGSLIDLKGYKILSVHQEDLNLDIYFEQVVLAQNFSDFKTYLFIVGFDPKSRDAVVLFKTQVDIDFKSSYNMYLEDITGDYYLDIVVQGFSNEDSVLYIFQRTIPNDVASYRPIFFDKVNGNIIINKYNRSLAYDEKKSRESYSISLERYEKQGEDMIFSKIEKYEYSQSQGKYYPLSASENIGRIDNDIYKTFNNLPKDEVYRFLYGIWYDVNAHSRLWGLNIENILFLSFSRRLNEISIFKNNSQEIAHIDYISKPTYNTLNISTKSIFSDLIVYNFWIKIIDIDNIEVKVDTGTDAYDKHGFSGVFRRFDDSSLAKDKYDKKKSFFVPNGNYVCKDIIYDFSYPNLTYIIENNIYYGIFNVFSFNNDLILEYEISMDDSTIRKSFIIEHNEKIVQKQKFSTIVLNPIKILKDEVSLIKGHKLKLERIEKLG